MPSRLSSRLTSRPRFADSRKTSMTSPNVLMISLCGLNRIGILAESPRVTQCANPQEKATQLPSVQTQSDLDSMLKVLKEL